jgi:hypothetical protein
MRHSKSKNSIRWGTVALVFALAVLSGYFLKWGYFGETEEEGIESYGSMTQATQPSISFRETNNFTSSGSGRRIYPYSIIRGGIESVEELKRAVQLDPVTADHFSGFDLTQARIVRLPVEKAVFVSYRVKDKVYWTHKRIKLARGERLITDGSNSARTRCGNRISETPTGISLGPREPSPEVLDTPEEPLIVPVEKSPPAAKPRQTDLFSPPLLAAAIPSSAAVPSGGRIPLFVPLGVGGGVTAGTILRPSSSSPSIPITTSGPVPRTGGSNPPPISASEPGTFLLLSSGLVTSWIAIRKKRT